MRITILFFLCVVLSSGCNRSGFNQFYKSEVDKADFALSVPRWLIRTSIPQDAKEEILPFVKGMKKMRLLKYNTPSSQASFKEFIAAGAYENYLSVNNNDYDLQLLTKEDDEYFKEIIVECKSEEDYILFAMVGKMKKDEFYNALAETKKQID